MVSPTPPLPLWPPESLAVTPAAGPLHATFAALPIPGEPLPHADASWLEQLVAHGRLHQDEATLAQTLTPARQRAFVAGRLALRAALLAASHAAPHAAPHAAWPENAAPPAGERAPRPVPPILRSPRGAPVLPASWSGSISHKAARAVALVAPQSAQVGHVGIDLERRPVAADLGRPSIASRILTDRERHWLTAHDHDALVQREQVLLHFAIKEAVYKAIDPLPEVQRYVGFKEVELEVHADGHVAVTLMLPELAHRSVQVAAQWDMDEQWMVARAWSW